MIIKDFKKIFDEIEEDREIERIDIISDDRILYSFSFDKLTDSNIYIQLKLTKNEIAELVNKRCFEIKKETDLSKKIKLYSLLIREISNIKETKNNFKTKSISLKNLKYKVNTYIQRLKNIEEKENLKDLSVFQLLEKYKTENHFLRTGQIMSNLESKIKQDGFDLYYIDDEKIKRIIIKNIIESKVSTLKNGR